MTWADEMLHTSDGIAWRYSTTAVPYPEAVAFMDKQVAGIVSGEAHECVWLTEHPPLYTAGARSGPGEILPKACLPVFATGRGGRVTYHGPGQRLAYVMLDLRTRGRDVRAFVGGLEQWIIAVLREFGIRAETRAGRIGVWVPRGADDSAKIAAIGVRVRRGVTFHGVSLNVDPDLSHYEAIVPCGIRDAGVTSLKELGVDVPMTDVDQALVRHFIDWMPPRNRRVEARSC